VKINEHTFVIGFLQTQKKKSIQKEMINCVKSVVKDIDIVKRSELTEKAKDVSIQNKDFSVIFASTPYFILASTFRKKPALSAITTIFNTVLDKLYEKSFKEMSDAFIYYDTKAEINLEIEPFSQLINQDTWKKLFGDDTTYQVKRLEIWQPPSKGLRKGYYIIRLKDGILLNSIRSEHYKGRPPNDIAYRYLSELKKQNDTFLKELIGEKC
jgi:hypothetical protein